MKKNYFLSLAVMLALGYTTIQAESLFVKPDASGQGASWDDACTLEDALSWAQDGDEIFVAKGTYTGSFKARTEVKVYGECNGNETTPPKVISAEGLRTFLKGNGKRVLYIDQKPATFIGFDISGGDASEELIDAGRGGGVYVADGGGTLKYCKIHDNVAADGSKKVMGGSTGKVPQSGTGGGAYIHNGRLEYCIVENNYAVINPWSNPDDGNKWSMGIGGGICLDATVKNDCAPEKAVVMSCIIRNNGTTPADDTGSYTSRGGGIAVKSGILVNSLIYGNAVNGSNNNGNVGGGVACVEKTANIINCTVVGNNVKGLGGGIGFQTQNAGGVLATVANCIAWDNVCREDSHGEGCANIRFNPNNPSAGSPKVTFGALIVPETTVSATAINDDPMFANAASKDFSLKEGSPAIDSGNDSAIEGFATDLLGNNRIAGEGVDIGCYEFGSTGAPEPGSGINVITEADGNIISTTYYTLQGSEIAYPTTSGIYIVKNTYESLRSQTQKVFISIK